MAITKEKLTLALQDQLGMTRQESKQIVDRLLDIMKDTLSRGEHLLISGFGKFSLRQKKARRGRNPQTRKSLTIPARKVVVFKQSGVLRRRLNGTASDRYAGWLGQIYNEERYQTRIEQSTKVLGEHSFIEKILP